MRLSQVNETHTKPYTGPRLKDLSEGGIPTEVLSDNAKTFKSLEVQEYIRSFRTNWKFNIEGASWWGGFFERQVKLVKRVLNKVVRNAKLTYEELLTVLIEVEGDLNSLPLSYVFNEDLETLTPFQLVIGRCLLTNPTNDTRAIP